MRFNKISLLCGYILTEGIGGEREGDFSEAIIRGRERAVFCIRGHQTRTGNENFTKGNKWDPN
jgi:hypothetical protein